MRQLLAEGLLTGPRGQYVNSYSTEQQCRRVRQLRERASVLRLEALELTKTAREVEQQLPTEATPWTRSPASWGQRSICTAKWQGRGPLPSGTQISPREIYARTLHTAPTPVDLPRSYDI